MPAQYAGGMEWYGWATWAVSLLAAIAGLVLGIRAEMRSNRYSRLWVVEGLSSTVTVLNRTGEDAGPVQFEVVGATIATGERRDIVRRDQEATIRVRPPQSIPKGSDYTVEVLVTWTRSRTGKQYKESAGRATLHNRAPIRATVVGSS